MLVAQRNLQDTLDTDSRRSVSGLKATNRAANWPEARGAMTLWCGFTLALWDHSHKSSRILLAVEPQNLHTRHELILGSGILKE